MITGTSKNVLISVLLLTALCGHTVRAEYKVPVIAPDQVKHIDDFSSDEEYWKYAVDQSASLEWKDAANLGAAYRDNEATRSRISNYEDMRFGMFIHWGICSVADGMWQGTHYDTMPEFLMFKAEIPRKGYVDTYASQFNPVNFDADGIVGLAKAAGMKYIVLTAKHVDGFCMYDTDYSDLNVVDRTPFKRDILRELETACRKQGIKLGIYYSQDWDWLEGGLGMDPSENETSYRFNHWDPSDSTPGSNRDYFLKKSFPQVRELLRNYDISYVWFDVGMESDTVALAFWETVRKYAPEVPVTSRIGRGSFWGEVMIPGDNGFIHANGLPYLHQTWEGCFTINHNWGYKPQDTDWKTPQDLLFLLVQSVALDGNALVDIGPTDLGDVPEAAADALKGVGDWMSVNGEAVHGTKGWVLDHEGPFKFDPEKSHETVAHGGKIITGDDFWFTEKDHAVYAINLVRPESRKIVIQSFASTQNPGKTIQNISLVGSDAELKWMTDWYRDAEGLHVTLPEKLPSAIGYVLKLQF